MSHGNEVPFPLYHKIKSFLTGAIESGQIKPGDLYRLLTELTRPGDD